MQKSRLIDFLSSFCKSGQTIQTHIPFRVGWLNCLVKFVKRVKKRPSGLLQVAPKLENLQEILMAKIKETVNERSKKSDVLAAYKSLVEELKEQNQRTGKSH